MNKPYHLHLVSDSTGETTHNLARACLVQFENLEVKTLEHSQIQNKTRMDRVPRCYRRMSRCGDLYDG